MCYDANTAFPSASYSAADPVEDAKQAVRDAITSLVEVLGEAAKDAIDDGELSVARDLLSEAEEAENNADLF